MNTYSKFAHVQQLLALSVKLLADYKAFVDWLNNEAKERLQEGRECARLNTEAARSVCSRNAFSGNKRRRMTDQERSDAKRGVPHPRKKQREMPKLYEKWRRRNGFKVCTSKHMQAPPN